jgi:hypothetical protein
MKMYRTIILPVLFLCETWWLPLREERRLRVFEKRVFRGIFGPKREEVTEEWRKLRNEELNDVYSPTTVRVINSRRMRLVLHVALKGETRGMYRALVGKLEERDHLEDPVLGGRIILRWIFRQWDLGAWTGSVWLRIGTGGELFLIGKETSGSMISGIA